MRIYLDCCCLQRPHDDQTQPRIRVETEAVLAILASVQSGGLSLLGSEALEYEIGMIPDEARRSDAMSLLSLSTERLVFSERAESMAEVFELNGIAAMDAVHLAMASCAGADWFVTCDDKFLHKARATAGLECGVMALLGMIVEVPE